MGEVLRLSPVMSSRKLLTLKWLRNYIAENHGSPSLREIAAGTGTSERRVRDALKRLEREGYIVRDGGPRGIRLVVRSGADSPLHLIPEV